MDLYFIPCIRENIYENKFIFHLCTVLCRLFSFSAPVINEHSYINAKLMYYRQACIKQTTIKSPRTDFLRGLSSVVA